MKVIDSWLTYFNYLNCKFQLLIQIDRHRQYQEYKGTPNKCQEELKGCTSTNFKIGRSLLTSYLLKLGNYSIFLIIYSLEEGHGSKGPGRKLACGHAQPVWAIVQPQLIQQKGMHGILPPNVLSREHNDLRILSFSCLSKKKHRFQVYQKIFLFLYFLMLILSFSPLKF